MTVRDSTDFVARRNFPPTPRFFAIAESSVIDQRPENQADDLRSGRGDKNFRYQLRRRRRSGVIDVILNTEIVANRDLFFVYNLKNPARGLRQLGIRSGHNKTTVLPPLNFAYSIPAGKIWGAAFTETPARYTFGPLL
jgi:hypothetical protein